MSFREDDGAPGCLPGRRPERRRADRFFAGFFSHGASVEGGREELEESLDNRSRNSSTWAVNTSI
jgi:hypothetical protein